MAVASWIRKEMRGAKASYAQVHHRGAYTAQALAETEHVSGHRVAKVVVVVAGGRPLQLVLPASRKVDLERVAAIAGCSEARLATERHMAQLFPDSELGAEPPLRRWDFVDLWVDESLRTDGDIIFPAGTHQDCIRMRYSEWQRVARPKVASFSLSPS